MYEVLSPSIEIMLDDNTKASYEADSYTLSNGRRVVWDYKSQSYKDKLGRVYTPVSDGGDIIGFEVLDAQG